MSYRGSDERIHLKENCSAHEFLDRFALSCGPQEAFGCPPGLAPARRRRLLRVTRALGCGGSRSWSRSPPAPHLTFQPSAKQQVRPLQAGRHAGPGQMQCSIWPRLPGRPAGAGTRTPMRLSEPRRPPEAVRPGPPGAASFPFPPLASSRGPHSCHPPFPVLPAATFGTGPLRPLLSIWRARSPFRLHRNRTCGTEPFRCGQAPKARGRGAHGARLLSASRRVDLVSCRSPSGRKNRCRGDQAYR